jgi:hypothetical protein
MSRSRLGRVAGSGGVALLPAFLLLCCAGRADASCGDYVKVFGPDGKVQPPAGHDHPTGRPCPGPNCTDGPKAPAPIPPAPTNPLPDGKALVTEAGGPSRTDFTVRPMSDAGDLPVRHPNSIFHPPRAS